MKYQDLFEEHSKDLFNDIERNAKPFIESGLILYRGMRKPPSDTIVIPVRKDRKPSDTPMVLHYIADGYFFEKYGIKARSQSIFTSQSLLFAKRYGQPVAVIPKDSAQYVYSLKAYDLFGELYKQITVHFNEKELEQLTGLSYNELLHQFDSNRSLSLVDAAENLHNKYGDEIPNTILKVLKVIIYALLDKFDYQHTDDPNSIPKTENEIMVYCNEYYSVDRKSPESYKLEISYEYLI